MNKWNTSDYTVGDLEYRTYWSFGPIVSDEYLKFVKDDIKLKLAIEEETKRQEWEHKVRLSLLNARHATSCLMIYLITFLIIVLFFLTFIVRH